MNTEFNNFALTDFKRRQCQEEVPLFDTVFFLPIIDRIFDLTNLKA